MFSNSRILYLPPLFWMFAIIMFFSGCVSLRNREKGLSWSKSEIVGWELKSQDTEYIEVYSFEKGGAVRARMGTPKSFTLPILRWAILNNNLIIYDDYNRKTVRNFVLLRKTKTSFFVYDGNRTICFNKSEVDELIVTQIKDGKIYSQSPLKK